MSLTLKLGSLAIRTLAKPIGNRIKTQAREHERFRRVCVGFAQWLHRVDMRLRLGLLQDPAAIDRQIARELKEAEAKRRRDEAPTVLNEAETKAEQDRIKKEKKEIGEHVKSTVKKPRIRPLSEAKAIESGANFISEAFLFLVATGLIVFESLRRSNKEKGKDAEVDERLERLEKEREEYKEKVSLLQSEIEALLEKNPFAKVGKPTMPPIAGTAITPTPATAQDNEERTTKAVSQPELPAANQISAAESTSGAEPSSRLPWLQLPDFLGGSSERGPKS